MIMAQEGTPPLPGVYVCWIESPMVSRFAFRKLMLWHDGKWSYLGSSENYRGHVYGWAGPIEAMELED